MKRKKERQQAGSCGVCGDHIGTAADWERVSIGPKIRAFTRAYLRLWFPTANAGATWVLDTWAATFYASLAEVRTTLQLTKEEAETIRAVVRGDLSGGTRTVSLCLEDAAVRSIDPAERGRLIDLAARITAAPGAHRAALAVWAAAKDQEGCGIACVVSDQRNRSGE